MITDPLVNFTLEVSTFTVRLKYTGLEVLLQPVRIRQWQVWKYLLSLDVIPRCSHVIVPGYHSLNRIPDYVDVNWLRQVESKRKNVPRQSQSHGNLTDVTSVYLALLALPGNSISMPVSNVRIVIDRGFLHGEGYGWQLGNFVVSVSTIQEDKELDYFGLSFSFLEFLGQTDREFVVEFYCFITISFFIFCDNDG